MQKMASELHIPINYAAILIRFVEKRGAEKNNILKDTGLDLKVLDDPEAMISFEQFKKLVSNALNTTQEPGLGLAFGKQLNLATHGILGFAAMSSDTMGQALEVAIKYFRTRTPLLELNFHKHENTLQLDFVEVSDLGEIRRFVIESLFSSFYAMTKFLFNNEQSGIKLHFTYSDPDYKAVYDEIFGSDNVIFSEEKLHISFPAEVMNKPLPIASSYGSVFKEGSTMNSIKDHNNEGLLVKVRRMLLQTPGKFPSLTELANQLHTSPRTLRRQLQRLDTSYQIILDDLRRNLAVQYLQNTKLTVDQIASLLDYNDPSNFGRAFKKWTGKPPSSYRKQ